MHIASSALPRAQEHLYPSVPPAPRFGEAERTAHSRLECLNSLEAVQRHEAVLEALRKRSADAGSSLPVSAWMAASHPPPGWAQRVFLVCSGSKLEAAVFLREKTLLGVPTGYFRGGEALGETLILCKRGREEDLLQLAVRLALQSHRAFLVLLDRPAGKAGLVEAEAASLSPMQTVTRTVHWEHRLRPTFDETVAPFGHRTRRNLRHSLRRVAQKGWQLRPALATQELEAALTDLSLRSTHPLPPQIAVERLALAGRTQGSFAMGLTDAQGAWLSCLVGRRVGSATQVFWQWNASGHGGESLCTTMRALLMREEITRGAEVVRYLGGTCELMQHCCTPSESRQSSFARRGLRLLLMGLLLRTRLASAGHPLREHLGR